MVPRSFVMVVLALGACGGGRGDDEDGDGDADADVDSDSDSDGDADVGVVDLLFAIDNSNSMAQEQASLTQSFGTPLSVLAAVTTSLHVGVISTDMGTRGYDVQTCGNGDGGVDSGDDGVLRTEPSPALAGCAETYPPFLTWEVGDDVGELDNDFACVSTLGTGGCGFEQQLGAVVKALTVHADGANAGFVRPGSLLGIMIHSDEEDCTVRDEPEAGVIFDVDAELGPLNLRCHTYADEYVKPVAEITEALLALRPGQPDLLVVAEMVGIPPARDNDCVLRDMTDEDFQCLLDLPLMQEVIDDSAEGKGERLRPSCDELGLGEAFPPRRMVQLAREVDAAGGTGIVRSICEADFRPALQAVADALAARLTEPAASGAR